MALRRLSPGGYEYLTGSVACADRSLEAGEGLADYYLAHGYPPGEWFGAGAAELGVSGDVTAAQMTALFGEGRHPDADRIEADLIAGGAHPAEAMRATKLGRRFAQYGKIDHLRSAVSEAYKQHNVDHGRPIGAPIDDDTRAQIRREVQVEAFQGAHGGRVPAGEELSHWLAEEKRQLKTAVAGYEMVFAPPKSVSVAWAVADEATRELVVSLHRQAVKDTLTHFERNAAFTRQGDMGEAQVDIGGITAAIFEHWDSRAGDPHLHTHVPISAKVKRRGDGKWTVLDTRTIHAAAVTMSEHYNSRIRDLTREHGAVWVQRPSNGIDAKRPMWELAGVPNELIAGFSQRAQQVETDRARRIVGFRREHGREPGPKEMLELSRRAQYGSRSAKQAPKTLAEHLQRWRSQATEIVPTAAVAGIGARVFGGAGEPVAELDIAALAASTRFVVSDHHSHFTRWNIESEAHRQAAHLRVPAGARDALVTRISDAVIAAEDTVALHAPSLVAEPRQQRRRSGESVFVEHNSQRYTTERTLREEAALVSWAHRGGGQRLAADSVERALAGSRLNAGQTRMVTEFARSGRRVQLALAPAGAGKTTAMKAFTRAWRSAGGRVFAFAPSARAAQELGDSIEATPHTLHEVTTALRVGSAEDRFDFGRGDVLIVDEAAMAGTHTLHDVVRYALRRGADVRLVGDDQQLGAVEAGGAIRLIAHDAGAVRFREVVRFADRRQATASLQVRAGDATGLDYYFEQGWVAGGSRETMRDEALTAWRADLDSGRQTLLIVPTNDDVVALNLQARAQRIERGDVRDGHRALLRDGTSASAGDWIVTRENDRLMNLFGGRDFVKNGDTWVVTAAHPGGALEVAHRGHHAATVLPADYVASNVELAYATTVNRVQGMTSHGSSHIVVPQNMTRHQLYPALTRAVEDNRLYVETHHHTIDSHRETPPEQTARDVLIGVLNHSGAETAATEELRASLGEAESLSTLVMHHNFTARHGVDERVERVLAEHAPTALDQLAEPALVHTLMNAEDLGWQAERLVPAAVAEGGFADAADPAAVLQWRIARHIEATDPPARTADPRLADINRWRTEIEQHVPLAAVGQPQWTLVWQHAAAGAAEGLDADTAIARAAEQLAARPSNDPMDDHRYVAHTLVDDLGEQRASGAGWQPPLPWMAHPDHAALSAEPELAEHLRELGAAITARAAELREQVAADQPAWTAGLGPRPSQTDAAAQWDEVAGLAAAYRETFRVTDNHPAAPLGPQPACQGAKSRAFNNITQMWRPPVTVNDQMSANQAAIDSLRDDVFVRRQGHSDDAEATIGLTDDLGSVTVSTEEGFDDEDSLGEGSDFGSGLHH